MVELISSKTLALLIVQFLFRGLCAIANGLKPYCWIKSSNPSTTYLFFDSWCFEIPLAFKPNFLNSEIDLISMTLFDFISDNNWDLQKVSFFFAVISLKSLSNWELFTLITRFGFPSLTVLMLALAFIIFGTPGILILTLAWVGKSFGKSNLPLGLSIYFG